MTCCLATFHTAVWLCKCQSILTQAQHSIEIDMVCQRISPFDSLRCSEEGPMSLGWPLAPQVGMVQYHHSMPQEDAHGEHPENAHLAFPHLRWRRDCSTTRSAARPIEQEHMRPYSFWLSSMRYLEYERAYWMPCFHNFPGTRGKSSLHDLPRTTM